MFAVLASFFSSPKLANSQYSAVHRADALRLLLVYKFGGFYLDLDYVVLNSLSHHNNIVVGNKPWDQLWHRTEKSDFLFITEKPSPRAWYPSRTTPSPSAPTTRCFRWPCCTWRRSTTPPAGTVSDPNWSQPPWGNTPEPNLSRKYQPGQMWCLSLYTEWCPWGQPKWWRSCSQRGRSRSPTGRNASEHPVRFISSLKTLLIWRFDFQKNIENQICPLGGRRPSVLCLRCSWSPLLSSVVLLHQIFLTITQNWRKLTRSYRSKHNIYLTLSRCLPAYHNHHPPQLSLAT